MKLLETDNFGLKLYNRFPAVYREEDINQKYALKRYLQVLGDGGFKLSIEDINGLYNLKDPDLTPTEVLPILYKHYGLDIFNGIPELYLRQLLPYVSMLWSKKGSIETVEYLSSVISGTKTSTEVVYEDNSTILDVKFEMNYSLGNDYPNVTQMKRILRKFIPFYCDLNIIYYYVFSDKFNIHLKEEVDITKVTDIKTESSFIVREGKYSEDSSVFNVGAPFGKALFNHSKLITPTEFTRDFITLVYKDKVNIETDFDSSMVDNIVFKIQEENIVSKVKENSVSIVTTPSIRNAVFDLCHFGKAVFGNSTYTHTTIYE